MARGTQDIVAALLASYEKFGVINHVDGLNLPTKEGVGSICAELLRLLFPGFFEDHVVHSSEIAEKTGCLIERLRPMMETEVRRSLEFGYQQGLATKCAPQDSAQVLEEFFRSLDAVRELLVQDVEAAYRGDPAASCREEVVLSYPCIEALSMQRCAHVLFSIGVPLLPRMLTEWAHSRTGIDLHPGAKIGGGLFIDHGTGVVVGETSVIGRDVKIYQGVTLGAKSFRRNQDGSLVKGLQRHPIIEDEVTIYAGATILGGDTVVGARSIIGGNVWLVDSVPPDSIVLMEGGRAVVQNRLRAAADYQI